MHRPARGERRPCGRYDHGRVHCEIPGGEKRHDFFLRASQAVDYIVSVHPNGKVAVVCHGGVIRGMLAYSLLRDYGEWWTYRLHTGSLSRLVSTADGAKLLTLSE
jgi:broad specificity phosphatase PhoE